MMLCTTIAPASKLQMEMPYAKKVGIVAAAHRTTRPPNVRRATWLRSSAWRTPRALSWLSWEEKLSFERARVSARLQVP